MSCIEQGNKPAMPEFSANISMLFREYEFIDRINAAAAAGFKAIEMQFPYRYPLDKLSNAVRQAGVEVILINAPVDAEEKRLGIACLPEYQARVKADLERIYDYAAGLGVRHVNVLAGSSEPAVQRQSSLDLLQDNLTEIAEKLQALKVNVLLEPVNPITLPGYLVSDYDEARQLLNKCALPNMGLQFDVFHAAMMGLDCMDTLRTFLDSTGHIQFADAPGRHEPGTGKIPFTQIFSLIDELGYPGWVGAEYLAQKNTLSSLDWFKPYVDAGPASQHPSGVRTNTQLLERCDG